MKKRLISLLLVLAMVLSAVPSFALAAEYNGDAVWTPMDSETEEPETEPSEPATDPSEPEAEPSEPETEPSEPEAEKVTWSFDGGTGTLTISGSGATENWQGGDQPWYGLRDQIVSVVVAEGVTRLGSNAFCGGYEKLTTVVLPASLKEIGTKAFYACTALAAIELPAGLKKLEDEAFASCTALATITMPQMPELEQVGTHIFMNCDSLTNLDFYTLPAIYEGMFAGVDGFTKLTIPECVTEISNFAFNRNENLTRVIFHDGVTWIGAEGFNECGKLAQVIFYGDALKIDENAFAGDILTAYYPAENATWTGEVRGNYGGRITWIAVGPDDIIPGPPVEPTASGTCGSQINWTYIKRTGVLTLSGTGSTYHYDIDDPEKLPPWSEYVDGITEIVVEEGITNLGAYLFAQCSAAQTIRLPEGLQSFGSFTFYKCSALTELEIPESLTNLGSYTFRGCNKLAAVNLPAGITEIPTYCFHGTALTSVVVPEGVTAIGDGAFGNCASLTAVKLPDTVTSIGSSAFAYCRKLAELNVPAGLTTIASSAFEQTAITEFVIPEGVTEVGSYAFSGCGALKTLLVPMGVTVFPADAIEDCGNLTVYCYPDSAAHVAARSLDVPCILLNPGDRTEYKIGLKVKGQGAASVNASACLEGSVITIELAAAEGSELAELNVRDSEKNVEVLKLSDTQYRFTMPACDVEVEVVFELSENPFEDVTEDAYYYEPVMWAVNNGVTTGADATHFEPLSPCTRGQVVTFLWRTAGKPAPESGENPFEDVDEAYYYDAILWAVENGITTGTDATHFEPGATCTRGQIVTFLYRYFE